MDETVEQAQNALPEDPADERQSQMKPKQLGKFPDLEESALPEDPAPGRQNPMKVENQDGELRASSDLDILDQRVKSMMMFSTGPCAYHIILICFIVYHLFVSSIYLSAR